MANRLTRIVTRTGDDGTTGLADGTRLPKNAPRVAAIGAVDELNSVLGLLLCEGMPADVRDCLIGVQHDLFDLGGELSLPGRTLLTDAHVARLEQAVEHHNADLPPLREFILPGGARAAALAHVARTVCRRAEREIVALSQSKPVAPALLQYLNRLSDLLFVQARVLNRYEGSGDIYWQPGGNRS
ncbi:MAG TPA: cob(I)yrinic acid a,c-diamide adenosyltransferase [Burkholderiales bacterium]|nr:cob(I)yrinic acid a,c-diamide adenosyltransferase [Burkholderiales bacterium]